MGHDMTRIYMLMKVITVANTDVTVLLTSMFASSAHIVPAVWGHTKPTFTS